MLSIHLRIVLETKFPIEKAIVMEISRQNWKVIHAEHHLPDDLEDFRWSKIKIDFMMSLIFNWWFVRVFFFALEIRLQIWSDCFRFDSHFNQTIDLVLVSLLSSSVFTDLIADHFHPIVCSNGDGDEFWKNFDLNSKSN